MGLDSIQPKRGREDMDELKREWNDALRELEDYGEDMYFLNLTGSVRRERLEKYVTDNADILNERRRRFLLASLRVKFEKED